MKSYDNTTTFLECIYLAEIEKILGIGNIKVTLSPIAWLRDPCFAESQYTHPSLLTVQQALDPIYSQSHITFANLYILFFISSCFAASCPRLGKTGCFLE